MILTRWRPKHVLRYMLCNVVPRLATWWKREVNVVAYIQILVIRCVQAVFLPAELDRSLVCSLEDDKYTSGECNHLKSVNQFLYEKRNTTARRESISWTWGYEWHHSWAISIVESREYYSCMNPYLNYAWKRTPHLRQRKNMQNRLIRIKIRYLKAKFNQI